MNLEDLSNGQRVRATMEGRVKSFRHVVDDYARVELIGVWLEDDEGTEHYFERDEAVFEAVEPEYIPGEAYRDALGAVYMYLPKGFTAWHGTDGSKAQLDYPVRPLVRLVPESA